MMSAFKPDGVGGEPNPDIHAEEIENGDVTPPAGHEEQPNETDPNAAATGETKPAEGDPNDPFANFSFSEPGEFGPEALTAALQKDPAAAEALEKNPELKNAVYSNARKAARAQKYDEILGSPEEAAVVVEGNNAFTGISGMLENVKDGDFGSVDQVVNAMIAQSVLRDEAGNPLKDEQGNPRTSGVVGRFLKNWFLQRMELYSRQAADSKDEEFGLALDLVMERAGLRAPSSANEGESEQLRTQREQLEADQKAFDQQRRQQAEADQQASETRVNSQIDSRLDGAIKSILDQATGLDAFKRGKVETDIRKELRKAIANSNAYRSERRNIEMRPLGSSREKALVELAQRYIQDKLPGIARNVFAKANASVVADTQQQQQRQAAREAASRSEIRTSLPPARTTSPADTNTVAVVEQELTAKLGRRPTTQEILSERMVRSQAAAAAR